MQNGNEHGDVPTTVGEPAVNPVIVCLEQYRIRNGETLNAFAKRLGIHKGWLSRLRRGLETPGPAFVRRAAATYPELGYVYVQWLQSPTSRVRAPQHRRDPRKVRAELEARNVQQEEARRVD